MYSDEVERRAEISGRTHNRCLWALPDRDGCFEDHASVDVQKNCITNAEGCVLRPDAERAFDRPDCSARPIRQGGFDACWANLAADSSAGDSPWLGRTAFQ